MPIKLASERAVIFILLCTVNTIGFIAGAMYILSLPVSSLAIGMAIESYPLNEGGLWIFSELISILAKFVLFIVTMVDVWWASRIFAEWRNQYKRDNL